MEKKLILLVGLPQSGKDTYAREVLIPKGYPIVHPDSIRLELTGKAFYLGAEDIVWATARLMVKSLHNVVVLNSTSINRKRRDSWKSDNWEREFHCIDVDKEECIERAKMNNRYDLISVIQDMAAMKSLPQLDNERKVQ